MDSPDVDQSLVRFLPSSQCASPLPLRMHGLPLSSP
jgi:hypothetical protein